MSSSVYPGNSSHASKPSRGNTDFGATNQRPEISQSEKNSEAIKAPMNSDDNLDRDSQYADYGVQNDPDADNNGTNNLNTEEETNARISIKSTDMSENMILFIVEKTILAFEAAAYSLETQKEGSKLDHNTLIAKFIKGEMELFYKPTWHVIVGDNYGAYFTHEEFNFIVYTLNNKWITVFKSNIPTKA